MKPSVFVAGIKNKGNKKILTKPKSIELPFSNSVDQIGFLNDDEVVMTAVMEYGILNLSNTKGKNNYFFQHYSQPANASYGSLVIANSASKELILFFSHTSLYVVNKKQDNKRIKLFLDVKKLLPDKVKISDEITSANILDTNYGCFSLNQGAIYFFSREYNNSFKFDRVDSINTTDGRTIPAKEIRRIFLMNEKDIFCITNYGELLYHSDIDKVEKWKNWKTIFSDQTLPVLAFGFLNEKSFYLYGSKLFEIKLMPGENAPLLNPERKKLFSLILFMNTGSTYGIAADDYDNDGSDELYFVDIFGNNRLYFLSSFVGDDFEGYTKDSAPERGVIGNNESNNEYQSYYSNDIGITSADIDESGSADIILSYLGGPPIFYLNNGKGYFRDVTTDFNLIDDLERSECVISGDVNNDGYLDLFFTSMLGEDKIYINSYGRSFNKNPVRLKNNSGGGSITAAFADVNNDGFLDLYIGKWMRENRLYLSKGNGEFTDYTSQSGASCGELKKTNSVLFADFDNDGDLDLFVGNRGTGNKLFSNNGKGYFSDISYESCTGDSFSTYGAVAADFDNDGLIDLFVNDLGNIHLYKNTGLNKNRVPLFKLITDQYIGTSPFYNGYNTAAIVFDKSRDGDIDIALGQYMGWTSGLVNHLTDFGNKKSFISVKIEGSESNRSGIGTKLKLFRNSQRDGFPDSLIAYREVSGGSGYASHSSKIQHFGIPYTKGNYEILVEFPVSGIKKKIKVIPGSFNIIKEHEGLSEQYFLIKKTSLKYFLSRDFYFFILKILLLVILLSIIFKFKLIRKKLIRLSELSYKSVFNIQTYSKTILISVFVYFALFLPINFSQDLFMGNEVWINNVHNFFLLDIFPLVIGFLAGVIFLKNHINNDVKQKQYPRLIDELYITLRKFNHGESLLMNLNRLSLLAKNYDPKIADADLKERFNIAVTEYKNSCFPELEKLNSFLTDLVYYNKEFFNSSNIILSSFERINDELSRYLLATENETFIPKDFHKTQENLINSIKQLKDGLSNLYDVVRNNLINTGSNIQEAFSITETKFRNNNNGSPKIITNFLCGGKKVAININELTSVMTILIQNSFEAFGESEIKDKTISVSSYADNGSVLFKVEDNGPGIDDNISKLIFTDGVTTKSSGHGFGLNYVKATVEKYGGKIWCEKSTLGGAAIIIELPTDS